MMEGYWDISKLRGSRFDSPRDARLSWKMALLCLWLVATVALASWWLIFGLQQVERLSQLEGETAQEMARQYRMLLSEGITLVLLLFGGGAALLYYIQSEIRRSRKLHEFFAAFTHDLKTSLASLRLQAESLAETFEGDRNERVSTSKVMGRLIKDTVRLELQLENSLLLASPDDSSRLLRERIQLSSVVGSMRHQWPELSLRLQGDAVVDADLRALESIFKNLLQNSVVHGGATEVSFGVEESSPWVEIRIMDNGKGFSGEREKLGHIFYRHSATSGSGLGLYLASHLTKRMGGGFEFCEPARNGEGFMVVIRLPGASS